MDCFVAMLLAMTVILSPFNAQAENLKNLTYDVYAGGFKVLEANLKLDLSKKDSYAVEMEAYTQGFLGALVPWTGGFKSHGWVMKDGEYRPQEHESYYTWDEETNVKTYTYNKDGTFGSLVIKDHDKPPENKEVETALTDNTVDVLTATLSMLQNTFETKECKGYSEIFDGKRRFGLTYTHQKEEALNSSRYNIYEGPASKCTVEVIPMGGKWSEKPRGWLAIQNQGRQKGQLPTIWVGNVGEAGPAVPVKILVKTTYGALVMHLTKYQVGDKLIVADKRKDEEG